MLNLHFTSPLHEQTILSGRNHAYFHDMPTADLSIKTMSNGRALYEIEGGCFAVEDDTYLVLNNQQPYRITIESFTVVQSFCLFFPNGWAEQVWQGLYEKTAALLEHPIATAPINFFERTRRADRAVFGQLDSLRHDLYCRVVPTSELEERLRGVLAAMILAEAPTAQDIETIPALRASTRHELYRRLHRARDYIHANLAAPLDLTAIAASATLSPYHFLRMFKQTFGQTPHHYLTHKRIELAQFLLARTRLPITTICLEVGFESLGSFSSKFRQIVGCSPRQYRAAVA